MPHLLSALSYIAEALLCPKLLPIKLWIVSELRRKGCQKTNKRSAQGQVTPYEVLNHTNQTKLSSALLLCFVWFLMHQMLTLFKKLFDKLYLVNWLPYVHDGSTLTKTCYFFTFSVDECLFKKWTSKYIAI